MLHQILTRATLFTLASFFINDASIAQQLKLQWAPREDLNILLPPSVRLYEAHGTLADGARVRAMYATIDLRDRNLRLRATGSNAVRQTTLEAYRQQPRSILAINGGYFSGNASVSLLVSDGETIAPGPVNGVPRGAFGLVNGKPEIVWPYAIGNALYRYDTPNEAGQPVPTATTPKGAQPWHPVLAMGGGPVLVKAGKIRDTSKEEGFGASHLLRHPRTAIGYIDEHTLVMMVVDGRQQTSAGVTITELAQLMLAAGCYEAVNLDGGGSSAMIAADEVVNIPVDVANGNQHSLRRNASALVLAEEKPSLNRVVITIDTDSDGYTESGLWRAGNHVNYYGSTASHLASADRIYNKATYTFGNITRTRYQLAAWFTVHEQNTTHAAYVLHHNNCTDTLVVNQRSLAGTGKWNVLGNFMLGEGDYLELVGKGREGRIVADAIRLVAHEPAPPQPPRGDLRIAVISDLNAGLGADTYEWQVDSIINRIPRLWQPDLVICGGDMVAGMGVADTATLTSMWAGFDRHIAAPLRKAGIPLAFTLGNHDGTRAYAAERRATVSYWMKPGHNTGLQFADSTHFPHYYSFVKGGAFIVSWDASSSEITDANLEWMKAQFSRPEAQKAKLRLVMGHLPLYSVAQERDSKGNVLNDADRLRKLLLQYNVHTYISGHQHAYYPGKRGKLGLLNTGAAGSGPRRWLTLDKPAVNTITLMDIFHARDTIVYTTYDIAHKAAKDMILFDEKVLPSAIQGVNGHVMRHDIRVTGEASGVLVPWLAQATETGSGTASVKIIKDRMVVNGAFSLKGRLLKKPGAMMLCQGRNGEEGQPLTELAVKSKNGSTGTFSGALAATEDTPELLSAGNFYIVVKTEQHPEGALRAQLYPPGNHAPSAVAFTSHSSRNTYAVRNIKALYTIAWHEGGDVDGDPITYTYQVAADSAFSRVLLQKGTGRAAQLKMLEQEWYALLGTASEGKPVTFFHRVITSDGGHHTASVATQLRLMKNNEPLEDYIEVPAPAYVTEGRVGEGAGSGALWDKQGRLWLADYGGTLTIKESDGSDVTFSPLKTVALGDTTYSLRPVNGICPDHDGNILVAVNRYLIKIDAATGRGIAVWEVPKGKRAITTPRVNDKGEIYAMSLFADDPNYVLKQSTSNPATFDVVRTLALPGRVLARTFAMTSDGLTLYFPDPGSPFIQQYTSKDGITYKRQEPITSVAAGCNAIAVGSNNTLYAAVRSGGTGLPSLHFRDDAKKIMWTLPLPEVDGAEARGIAVSADGNTVIFCSWDKGGGFYRFVRKE